MVWYDNWPKARSREDARVSGEGRSWQRGRNEQISIILPVYRKDLPPKVITYDYTYQLFSSRFPLLNPAADPITDPVTVDAVSSRDVGITRYGADEVTYGTPNASHRTIVVDHRMGRYGHSGGGAGGCRAGGSAARSLPAPEPARKMRPR